jgi:ATP/ADP translocase
MKNALTYIGLLAMFAWIVVLVNYWDYILFFILASINPGAF